MDYEYIHICSFTEPFFNLDPHFPSELPSKMAENCKVTSAIHAKDKHKRQEGIDIESNRMAVMNSDHVTLKLKKLLKSDDHQRQPSFGPNFTY